MVRTLGSRSGDRSKGAERFPERVDAEALVLREIEGRGAFAACLDEEGATGFEGDPVTCGRSLLITTSGLTPGVDFFDIGVEGSALRSSRIIF
jgi:hypothetical protein